MSSVRIVAADEGWAAEYDVIAADLAKRLGTAALAIHHIGSTAVPGLAAKDVIDVQVSVPSGEDVSKACSALAKHGYRVNPSARDHPVDGSSDAEQWGKGYASSVTGRRVHVHIRAVDRLNHRYALLFRDFLREHAAMAAAYGEAKRRLGEVLPEDSNRYAEVKDPICDLIYLSAEEWATRTGWQPPELKP